MAPAKLEEANLRAGGGEAAKSMDRLSGLLKYLKYVHTAHYDNA